MLVEYECRAFLEDAFESAEAEDEIRQFRILFEYFQRLSSFGFCLTSNTGGLCLGGEQHFGGLAIRVRTDIRSVPFAFGLKIVREHLALGGHSIEYRLRHAFWQLQFFDSQEFNFQTVVA